MLTEQRLLDALDIVSRETGYPPTPDELNLIFGVERIQSTRVWRRLAAAGAVRYDDDDRVIKGEIEWGR